MSTALTTLTHKLATRLDMGDGTGLIETLKATAFKGQVSDAQMTALMVVANHYGLNPWTKEIYAFPDKNNGIVPVVGVDGWSRIINNHAQFDGMDFEQDAESCTCIIFRKDRSHPIRVTEYMAECRRAGVGPWASHPRRMLRHKAMIQCARLAFGYGGIYDQDEAERIVESIDASTGEVVQQKPAARPALPDYAQADFDKNLPQWRGIVQSGRKTPDELIAMVSTKGVLSDSMKQAMRDLSRPADVTDVQPKGEAPMTAAEQQAHDAFVSELGG
jgi:phage recombination protein Bet